MMIMFIDTHHNVYENILGSEVCEVERQSFIYELLMEK